MRLFDSHLHTSYSFDSDAPAELMCAGYARLGFEGIAVTDHYDIDGIEDGYYADVDLRKRRRELEALRERYAGNLDIVCGIELGQPHLRSESAKRFLEHENFGFVIASVHNIRLTPDFIFINYPAAPDELIESLYRRYVVELAQAAAFPGADALAHITYPLRYIHRDGRDLDLSHFYGEYRKLFHVMTESGVALELNTSGLRKGDGTSPTEELLALYRDCGGTLVSCGSDAHLVSDCGADIENGYEMLRRAGFTSLRVPGATKEIPL